MESCKGTNCLKIIDTKELWLLRFFILRNKILLITRFIDRKYVFVPGFGPVSADQTEIDVEKRDRGNSPLLAPATGGPDGSVNSTGVTNELTCHFYLRLFEILDSSLAAGDCR